MIMLYCNRNNKPIGSKTFISLRWNADLFTDAMSSKQNNTNVRGRSNQCRVIFKWQTQPWALQWHLSHPFLLCS